MLGSPAKITYYTEQFLLIIIYFLFFLFHLFALCWKNISRLGLQCWFIDKIENGFAKRCKSVKKCWQHLHKLQITLTLLSWKYTIFSLFVFCFLLKNVFPLTPSMLIHQRDWEWMRWEVLESEKKMLVAIAKIFLSVFSDIKSFTRYFLSCFGTKTSGLVFAKLIKNFLSTNILY